MAGFNGKEKNIGLSPWRSFRAGPIADPRIREPGEGGDLHRQAEERPNHRWDDANHGQTSDPLKIEAIRKLPSSCLRISSTFLTNLEYTALEEQSKKRCGLF